MKLAVVFLLALVRGAAFGQAVAPPAFEVATVRRANPQAVGGGLRGGPGTDDPGRIAYSNLPLLSLLVTAYHMRPFQIFGPDWLKTEKYDVAAKIPDGATETQFEMMLQRLLAERFHLALHHETRDFRAYELVVGKNGPKLKESVPNAAPDQSLPPTFGQLSPETRSAVVAGMPLATNRGVFSAGRIRAVEGLAEDLSMFLGAPVVNSTGLTGRYDYNLAFERPGSDAADGDPLPSIFTAVQEQLGLRLEEKKLPFDVVVVDRADKVPAEN